MTPDRWTRVKETFQAALAHDSAEREAFLVEACAGDAALRDEVDSLLEAYEGAGDFMLGVETEELGTRDTARGGARRCPRCEGRFAISHFLCPDDGEVLVEDEEALVGATLDGLYQIERLVGRGGFGSVYLARHALLRDEVAIKVLRRDLTANPDFLRRFLREGRVARTLRHPYIVTTHDLRVTSEGLAFMVMEYVEGPTLREILERDGALAPERVVELLSPIAEALDQAHALGVVHRDLKPENVVVGEDTVKLLDLGLAKLREMTAEENPSTGLTLPGQWIGTPRYMSPEQWGERPRDGNPELDGRTDVYGLGAIGYELVTGRPPFSGTSAWDLRREHVESPLVPAQELVPAVPPSFGKALARALSKDRADRQSSPGALVDDLRRALTEKPAPRFASSRRVLAWAAAGFLVLAGAATLWGLTETRVDDAVVVSDTRRAAPPKAAKAYREMSDDERVAFVDDRVRAVSRDIAGREYLVPPTARQTIKKRVDWYAMRVGGGVSNREDLATVVERARGYASHLGPIFAEHRLSPLLGVYIPMIESEYKTTSVSSAGARGMFQIMPSTGARYGASPEDLDDADKSARIAARYLASELERFGRDRMSVALSIAAYNRGAAGIERYLKDVTVLTDDEADLRFWELLNSRDARYANAIDDPNYVAQFFAAAVVCENPQAFGLAGGPLSDAAR
jgi:predicted Ser/Thr protein kinase